MKFGLYIELLLAIMFFVGLTGMVIMAPWWVRLGFMGFVAGRVLREVRALND
jgi:hypothetical protein